MVSLLLEYWASEYFPDSGVHFKTPWAHRAIFSRSNRLTDSERASLITSAVSVKNGLKRPFPIVAGTSHAGTYATIELTKMAQELGADGVMVTPTKEPSGPPSSVIMEYYGKIAQGCPG